MTVLLQILLATGAMSVIALVGLLLLTLNEQFLQRILGLLVAFAAGTLIGGTFLHLVPESLEQSASVQPILYSLLAGFIVFLLMEQFLNWHHEHGSGQHVKKPVTHLILIADGIHNFLGGLAIGASFVAGPGTGLVTWLAAAAHEIPQELGDFGILLDGGWNKSTALWANFLSALSIIPGGVLAYFLSGTVELHLLLPFAAGNFLYIGASDLIPAIKHSETRGEDLRNTAMFVMGILLIGAVSSLR